MSGDHSRDSFDALRDFAGVFLQQGRPVTDADWSELVQVLERRIRAGTVDSIGRAVVPRETEGGFEIRIAGTDLEIGRGRMYLDGMLIECHGAANFSGADATLPDPVFDRARAGDDGPEGVLDEMISPEAGDFVSYASQPYWPHPDPLPGEGGVHLAYVVAWQREVTPIENPDLLDPALGGIDTTTRWQTVWQVRLVQVGDDATCATPDAELADWPELIAASTARLTTATIDVEDPEDPCLVPPTDGYTGVENQLYRVEIHSVGDTQGDARFKFSRENASVVTSIESFGSSSAVTVGRIGRDDNLSIKEGDWVELTDDRRELAHRSGLMLRVSVVHAETREIEFEGPIDANPADADLIPSGVGDDTPAARRSRLIRWDQAGIVRLADNTEWTNLDAPGSDGLIPVPPDGRAVLLESGITVSFSTADGPGGWRTMDYWRFAARTAGTQIETLRAAPPEGIQRHYARLAMVRMPGTVLDCRTFWPPEFEGGGECCGCTVCVTPESHATGALTIQAAIEQVGPEGGTVCLAGGGYLLDAPLVIANRNAIAVTGQGMATLLVYRGIGDAIQVLGSVDISLERFSLFVLPGDQTAAAINGVRAVNAGLVALRRLAVVVATTGEARTDRAIALDGLHLAGKIEECLAVAPIALGGGERDPDQEGPPLLAIAELRVLDNILLGGRDGVRFDGLVLNLAAALFARNLVFGQEAGMRLNWFAPPLASTLVEASTVSSNRDGIVAGVSDLRLQDCQISGGPQTGDGVRLIPNLVPEQPTDAQIVGNGIFDLAGAGLRIEGNLGSLIVKRNVIRRCGEAGITTDPKARIRHAAIDNNLVEDIAGAAGLPGTAGILVTNAVAAQIAGNAVRAVGTAGASDGFFAGIAVQGVGTLAIGGNSLAEIGPMRREVGAAAILARPPYFLLALDGNRITGLETRTDEPTGWCAIEIGSAGVIDGPAGTAGLGPVPGGYMAEVPGIDPGAMAYVTVGETLYAMSRASLHAVAQTRLSQINLLGNQISHAAPQLRPLVNVFDAGTIAASFGQNQCMLMAGGGGPPLVRIGAQRIAASANTVLHQSDTRSMLLTVATNAAAAPVGNITSAGIDVIPGGLGAPFVPLNPVA